MHGFGPIEAAIALPAPRAAYADLEKQTQAGPMTRGEWQGGRAPRIKEPRRVLPYRYNSYFGNGSIFTPPDGGHVAHEAQVGRSVIVDEYIRFDAFNVEREAAYRAIEAEQEQAHAFGKRRIGLIGRGRDRQNGPPRLGLMASPQILRLKRKSDNNNYQT
ncbi:hypothetical protein A6456_37315 [Paraburkholderia tropica]|nr:hypothetical protein A6456_37315 [Paraburkholderia tropica]